VDISNIDEQHPEHQGKGILNSVLNFPEILSWEADEDTDIIKGVISKENLVFISGQPKTGKTSLALDLGLSLAFNEEWFGLNVLQRSKILFLTGEGGQSKIIDRIKVLGHDVEAEGFSDYFRLSYETNLDLVDDESFAQFIARLANLDIDVLIIDPLVCFHSYEENASGQMSELVKRLQLIIESLKISIIVLHHDTKQGRALRGHSILEGAYDTLMHLVYNEPKPVKDKKGKPTLRLTNEYWSLDFTCKHAEGPGKWKLSRDGIIFSKKTSESTKDQ
jgi:RecA-family ATPase